MPYQKHQIVHDAANGSAILAHMVISTKSGITERTGYTIGRESEAQLRLGQLVSVYEVGSTTGTTGHLSSVSSYWQDWLDIKVTPSHQHYHRQLVPPAIILRIPCRWVHLQPHHRIRQYLATSLFSTIHQPRPPLVHEVIYLSTTPNPCPIPDRDTLAQPLATYGFL
ncbi:hypothetical protein HYDPIDRAFT_32444 [Hydnomerulius pinastri MD-312]|uniref:Unplaced genomic scaffold scaffold_41, whole genome shotgun sequence n=1 Tax=Hydnomerulius pinastri MD-312 TaxID=994086 RepID=A0A0C9V477_9AGAM|nr:hypothetical protein HYDPIDRAFT_32444 [Hydnomerulius pinastri MD-312]